MKKLLILVVVLSALLMGGLSGGSASADECLGDPTIPLVQIENAAACGSTGEYQYWWYNYHYPEGWVCWWIPSLVRCN